jgi:hypothetical protein
MPCIRVSVNAVAADPEGGDDAGFVVEPFGPAAADEVFIEIMFRQLDKEMIMAGLAFHETTVELSQIGVFQSFAEAFEAFAAAGFDQCEAEEAVEKTMFFAAAFLFEFEEAVHIDIFSLGSQPEPSSLQFGQHEPEMAPFLGDDGGEVGNEAVPTGIALNERDTAGRGFLFAPGVVGEDLFERNGGEIDPARVGWQLKAEDVLLAGARLAEGLTSGWARGGFHNAKLRYPHPVRKDFTGLADPSRQRNGNGTVRIRYNFNSFAT